MTYSEYEHHGVRTSRDIKSAYVDNNVPTAGIHEDLTFEQYQSLVDPDGWPLVNASSLKHLARSPAHYHAHLLAGATDPTPAMRFGTLCHTGILEAGAVAGRYIYPPGDLYDKVRTKTGRKPANPAATNEGRAVLARFKTKHAEKEVITAQEYYRMLAIVNSLRTSPRAEQFLATGSGVSELTCVWQDVTTAIWCKARLDFVQRGSRVVDLKTTRSADPIDFAKSLANFAYYRQAAHYLEAAQRCRLDCRRFAIVAVESEPPHGVAAAELSLQSLGQGQREIKRLMIQLQECRIRDHWPGYLDPGMWELPQWAQDGQTEPPVWENPEPDN